MSAELEGEVRIQVTRELVSRWLGLFKSLSLYSWEHGGVEECARRVMRAVQEASVGGSGVDIAVRGDSLYIDGARLRPGGPSSLAYRSLVRLLTNARVSSVFVDVETVPRDLQLFGHLVLSVSERRLTAEEMRRELAVRGAAGISVTPMADEEEIPQDLEQRAFQRRVYTTSIGVLKSVFNEARARDRVNLRRVKRVVQQLMESFEHDAAYMLNLTAVKNYDEYTFNHSVNVGTLAIALGRAVGLSRRQLYVVGQAGMLHDLGKLCIPKLILNKPGRLTPEEREIVRSHPTEGFLMISKKQGVSAETIGVALGAYEHHMTVDGGGYPDPSVKRPLGALSRILAIVDRYDAMTSARVYRSAPISPHKALSILYHSHRQEVDQTLLRYFMNMLGCYPLGSAVRLSDDSVAVVVGSGAAPGLLHFPRVRLVLDRDGRPAPEAEVDLSERAKDPDGLRIVEALDGSAYGIDAIEYLL